MSRQCQTRVLLMLIKIAYIMLISSDQSCNFQQISCSGKNSPQMVKNEIPQKTFPQLENRLVKNKNVHHLVQKQCLVQ